MIKNIMTDILVELGITIQSKYIHTYDDWIEYEILVTKNNHADSYRFDYYMEVYTDEQVERMKQYALFYLLQKRLDNYDRDQIEGNDGTIPKSYLLKLIGVDDARKYVNEFVERTK